MVQKKFEHSYAAKPKEVHDNSRSNSSLPFKIHYQKVINQEKGPGVIFSGLYVKSPNPKKFSQGQELNLQGQKQNTGSTHEKQ